MYANERAKRCRFNVCPYLKCFIWSYTTCMPKGAFVLWFAGFNCLASQLTYIYADGSGVPGSHRWTYWIGV